MSQFYVTLLVTLLIAWMPSQQTPQDQLKAYPKAEVGAKRLLVFLPTQEQESDFRVELQIGKWIETDPINRYFLSGTMTEETIQGWGYPMFVVKELGEMAGTRIGVEGDRKIKRFITLGGEPQLLRYNSKLPVVVYVPEDAEVRYRIWKTEDEGNPMEAG